MYEIAQDVFKHIVQGNDMNKTTFFTMALVKLQEEYEFTLGWDATNCGLQVPRTRLLTNCGLHYRDFSLGQNNYMNDGVEIVARVCFTKPAAHSTVLGVTLSLLFRARILMTWT